MRTLALLAAALAALVVLPSASAMAWVPPPQPDPDCTPTPPPSQGGIMGEVQSILHTQTTAACSTEQDAEDTVGIGYGLAIEVADIIIGSIPFDELQDAACRAVYGDPNEPGEPLCQDVTLDLGGVWLGTW